ncbi:unnamed protein product, partial [Polarella glacialis]
SVGNMLLAHLAPPLLIMGAARKAPILAELYFPPPLVLAPCDAIARQTSNLQSTCSQSKANCCCCCCYCCCCCCGCCCRWRWRCWC